MCIANHGDPDEDMPNDGPRWKYWVPNARAAIAAVAEWLHEQDGTPMAQWGYSPAILNKQLEQPK